MSTQSKIIFANQLRGIAALCVVFAHLGYVFWMARDTVANFIGAKVMEGPAPSGIGLFVSEHLNLGVFGVAIFFLISGFVIPFSVEKTGRLQFIVARGFRIYPTYIVSLAVALSVVWASSRYWGKPFQWDLSTILQNMTLVHTLTGAPSVDLVNWTLAIEIKFYILVFLLASVIRNAIVWPLLAFSLAVFLINKVTSTALGTELVFVAFMLVGVLFNYLMRGMIDTPKFYASAAALLAMFFLGWNGTPWPDSFMAIAPNYAYAVVIFGVAYSLREKFKASKALDFFADISYPLYITHSLVGYSAMRFMFEEGMRFRYIVPITAAIVISVAYALHRLIEMPSVKVGREVWRMRKMQSA